MPGFYGTRASMLVDVALTIFVVMPFALLFVIREARRRHHQRHRRLQLVAFAVMTVAVAALEVDIRLSGGTTALAGRAAVAGGIARGVLLGHITVAVLTWLGWLVLLVRSSRAYGDVLPGSFSRRHRQLGRVVHGGVSLTAASGTVLYVLAFAL